MRTLINNPYNLDKRNINEITNKLRVIIVDKNNNIIITKYADMYMLPGGKVDRNESNKMALLRELKEELGINFSNCVINEYLIYENYIKNYNKVDSDKIINKLNKTCYYIIKVEDINKLSFNKKHLSEKEVNNNFSIDCINLYQAIDMIANYNSINIRNEFFKKEITDVINNYIKEMEKHMKVDLHTHTNYSDGDLSPDELIKYAKNNNINIIAITDHDTLNGIKNIKETKDIKIINGIELSCKVNKGRMHLLGYDVDINNKDLNDKIYELRDNSLNTLLSLIVQLKVDFGIVFKYDDIKDLINSNHHLGRPDLAKLLMKYGYVDNVQEAFDKYLNVSYDKIRGSNKWITYKEAIYLILKSGGIPVLAHPKSLKLKDKELLLLIKDMIECGLKGIEVYHSSHNRDDIELYKKISKDLGLLTSGGSDYHGKITKPDIEIGKINKEDINVKKLTLLNKII